MKDGRGIPRLPELLETIYRVDVPKESWQRRVAEEVFSRRDLGEGLLAYEFDASDPYGAVRLGTVVDTGNIPQFRDLAKPVHVQSVGRSYHTIVRHGTHEATLREFASKTGLTDSETSPLTEGAAAAGYEDIWAVCSVNPDATGIAFAIPFRGTAAMPDRLRVMWTRIGVHIAASHRLRKRFTTGRPEDAAAGVLDPAGRDLELSSEAVDDREALTRFVRTLDRVRARERRLQDAQVLSVWRGLLSGRWSVVDHIDTDGKHYMLLFDNDPEAAGPRALTRRERQVATYAAQGHTNKAIAYELGLSVSTVATHLRSALAKLGLSHRTDLVWLYGRLRKSAPRVSSRAPRRPKR